MVRKRIVIFGWANSVHVQRWAEGIRDRGYEVKVISLDGQPIQGCETVNFSRKGRWSYITHESAAVREALDFKPDLIHVHYVTGFGLWGIRSRFSPTVVSVWGADVVDFPSNWWRRRWIKYILKKATHITATSEFLRKTTLSLLTPNKQQISVIPFGVKIPDTAMALPNKRSVKICFIKAHKPKYGPDILIKAMKRVVAVVPNISLSIAGEGYMTSELMQLTSELDLKDCIDFVGFVPNNKIYSFLQQHHFMVMPSVMDSESFGVAVIEAAACGRPVIASRVGGVSEVLRDGQTGILVQPKDINELSTAIIQLSLEVDTCKKMGLEAYNFAKQNYSWDQSLDKMTDLYERLIYEASQA
ncbi:MAG: glycosyltransferase family 4 protein [candidate division Zixibacteria bacterium]|nr:glycosyltransferase family 4 protein [candidate division Zixibacteria bacterium]